MFIFCCYIDFGYQWNGFSEVHYMSSPEYLQKHLPIVKKMFWVQFEYSSFEITFTRHKTVSK